MAKMKKKPIAKPVKKVPTPKSKPMTAKAPVKAPVKPASIGKKHPVMKSAVAKVLKKVAEKVKPSLTKNNAKPVKIEKPIKLVKKSEIQSKQDKFKKKDPEPIKKAVEKYKTSQAIEKDKKATKTPEPVKVLKPVKEDIKKLAAKAPKKNQKKTEENDLVDDFVSDDIDGIDEIGEYAEELKAVEELSEESEEIDIAFEATKEKNPSDDEVVLTDAEGRRYCRVRECDQAATVDSYCRYHYLLLWKNIQVRKKILADGKLARYVEELTSRYPDKFLEVIRRDLRTEKDFLAAIQEMEIDESAIENDLEDDAQSFIEEVRGIGEAPSVDDDDY